MLCIDILGVFDNVLYTRLLDNLRKRKASEFIIRWVTSFLQERTTIIKVIKGESKLFYIEIEIP
jgi:hypothetical protein